MTGPAAAPKRGQRAASAAHKSLKEPAGDDSWDDSDDDVAPKPAARAAAAKRKGPRAAGEGGGAAGAGAGRPRRAKQQELPDVDDITCFEVIKEHPSAMDVKIKAWVQSYKTNRSAAAADLLSAIVRAAGCEEDLSEEDVEGGEVDELAARLTQTVTAEGGHQLFTNTRAGRAFAEHYCVFWDKALRGLAAADCLFDDFELNDKLTRLVTALSISVVRSFRHAATLTAAQLVSTWITVSEGLAHSRDLTKAQLDAEERQKGGANKQAGGGGPASATAAALRRTLERCHARVEDLRNFRSVIFSGVFSHRFRDVSEDIRCIVIEAIGDWVVMLPSEFLGDSHLKYLAWALSDRAPSVRRQALDALTKLYASSDNVPRMADFSARFKGRFCELMYDTDLDVAAAGLGLLAALVAHGIVAHQDVSGVYKLLTLPHADVAAAAAELVVQLLAENGRERLTATAARLRAAADAAADAAAAGGGGGGAGASKGKGGRGKAKQQAAAAAAAAGGAGGAAASAAAAAEGMLEDPDKLQLAGLLAVMGRMAAAEPQPGAAASPSQQQASQQASQEGAAGGAVLPHSVVVRLVEALWEPMHATLTDSRGLCGVLADDAATELWGRTGCSHLAGVMAAAAHMAIHSGASTKAGGRKGRFGARKAAAAGGAAGEPVDEEAQQEVTVLLMQQLPALLTKYQAEPTVAAPLLSMVKQLRLELYLLRGAAESYRSLLTQVDGLLQRHGQQELLLEAAGVLVYASGEGPAALQEVGCQVLGAAASTASAKLAAAAAAVGRLSASALAEGVADLADSPDDAPDALTALQTSARRVHVLLAAGSASLARDKQLLKTCQALLKASLEGRELGPDITAALLHTTNAALLFQLAALQQGGAAGGDGNGDDDTSGVAAYVQQRAAFVRVLEGVFASGADEHLVTPGQLLAAQQQGGAAGVLGLGGGTPAAAAAAVAATPELPADLAAALSAGLHTLQDLAYLMLTDLLLVENGAAADLMHQVDHGGDGSMTAAAAAFHAAPGGFGRLQLPAGQWQRVWTYVCSVLERETPEAEDDEAGQEDAVAGGGGGDEDDPDDDFDDWDATAAAARRAARAALRRDALAAAAAGLSTLKQRAVMGLVRLLGYRLVPDPTYSWLLTRLVTLMEGYGPQAASATRGLLVHLKSSDPDAFVAAVVDGLAALYAAAQDAHGDRDEHAGRGDAHDKSSWAHVAAVSSKLAGLFQGHNLSQVLLAGIMDDGLAWALGEPISRAAFPATCLAPFLTKLSSTGADRLADVLTAQLQDEEGPAGKAAREEAGVLGCGVAALLAEDETGEAAAQLESFLGHVKERAAGKKVTRGVLKTPGRAAAAAAAADSDEEEEDDEQLQHGSDEEEEGAAAPAPPAAARRSTGGRRGGAAKGASKPAAAAAAAGRKRSRIRFAGDDDAADGAGSEDGGGGTAASDGWQVKKRSPAAGGSSGVAASPGATQQQRRRGRPAKQQQQQQQQPEDSEEEDAVEPSQAAEEPQRGGRRGAAGGAAARGRAAMQAAAASQSQSQSQQSSGGRRACQAGRAAATASGSLRAQSQGNEDDDAAAAGCVGRDFSPEDLPVFGRRRQPAAAAAGGRRQAGSSRLAVAAAAAADSEDADMADADGDGDGYDTQDGDAAATGGGAPSADLAAGMSDDEGDYEGDDEEQQQRQGYGDSQPGGGGLSQGVASLQVVMDDLMDDDGEEVDEPPPARRNTRRRR